MTTLHDHETTGFVGSVGALVIGSLRFLRDLFDRIVNSIKCIAPAIVAIGCEASASEPVEVPPVVSHEVVRVPHEAAKPAAEAPKPIGKFEITFYYVVTEDEVAPQKRPVAANDNHAVESDTTLTSILDQVTLYTPTCKPIADVSSDFASALALQGTGKLKDGRVLNIANLCNCGHSPCFQVTAAQWGTGGSGRPLQPFRTVAVDPRMIKLGSLLYVPILEGKQMPGRSPWGGFIHDGCVVADDVGGGIKGTQLDLFVGRRGWFAGMARSGNEGSHSWAKSVPVFDGTALCERNGRQVARKAGAI